MFIISEDVLSIAHPDSERAWGLTCAGWVGTDANGYNFGPGYALRHRGWKWVSYV